MRDVTASVKVGDMPLRLDHVILRSADVRADLAELSERAGLPILAPAARVGALTSGIVRAGGIDIELLEIGAEPPAATVGYGLGFTSDRPLVETLAALRAAGVPTSAPIRAHAGAGRERRAWRAAQVHGLLPEPFPVRTSLRPPGLVDRLMERTGGVVARVPRIAAAMTRDPGATMVVVTEYLFDVEAVRSRMPSSPDAIEVHVGVGEAGPVWDAIGLEPGPLRLHHDGPAGVGAIVLASDGEPIAGFALGQVRFLGAAVQGR